MRTFCCIGGMRIRSARLQRLYVRKIYFVLQMALHFWVLSVSFVIPRPDLALLLGVITPTRANLEELDNYG